MDPELPTPASAVVVTPSQDGEQAEISDLRQSDNTYTVPVTDNAPAPSTASLVALSEPAGYAVGGDMPPDDGNRADSKPLHLLQHQRKQLERRRRATARREQPARKRA